MSMGTDTTWVGKKPLRRIGGMSDALSIAADLGFSVPPPPSQEEVQNLSSATGEKGDDLIKVLRELTTVQRKIADLQVELQGRKDDKNVAHLTHVSEMEKKCETLARITTILKDVIQNKDRIIARLQQPYSLDCIPVEAEYQEMLRPIPVALASCTRFFEAMSATRESFATLQNLRVGHSATPLPTTPAKDPSHRAVGGDSEHTTLPAWKNEMSFDDLAIQSLRSQELERQEADDENSEVGDFDPVDGTSHRRLSWPPSVKKNGL
ncbi:AUGMIN subunit 2-like [Gossypium australe]|uniref:AUGMIN subunit 2-like n=1 Tax=Gossypium australe TaxID=47621 RepID=A0A5B6UPM2_9ROSI|nr:AUGMIN subunit 2-like [Gossypium australe]